MYYYKLQSSFSYGMQWRRPLVSPTGWGGSQPVTPSALALPSVRWSVLLACSGGVHWLAPQAGEGLSQSHPLPWPSPL